MTFLWAYSNMPMAERLASSNRAAGDAFPMASFLAMSAPLARLARRDCAAGERA
jgi:hypothetical protein